MTWPWEDINKAVEAVQEEHEKSKTTTLTQTDDDGGGDTPSDPVGAADSWQIGANNLIKGFFRGLGSAPDVVQTVHSHQVLAPAIAGYDIFEWYSYSGFNSNPTANASAQSGPDPELVNGSMTILQNIQLDVDTAESKFDYFPFSESDDMFVDIRKIGDSLIITYTDVEKSLINETFSFPSNMSLTDEMDRIIWETIGNVMKSYNVRRNSFIKTKKAPSLTQINFSSLDISTITSSGRGH